VVEERKSYRVTLVSLNETFLIMKNDILSLLSPLFILLSFTNL